MTYQTRKSHKQAVGHKIDTRVFKNLDKTKDMQHVVSSPLVATSQRTDPIFHNLLKHMLNL